MNSGSILRSARRSIRPGLLVVALAAGSCATDDRGHPPGIAELAPHLAAPGPGGEGDGDFLGLSLRDAEALAGSRGLAHRVVSRNGRGLVVTMDHSTGRVNFDLVRGRVARVSRG